jgi:GTPase
MNDLQKLQDGSSAPQLEKALIVHPVLPKDKETKSSLEYQIDEARGLAHAIFLDVADIKIVRLSRVTPAYLIGKGTREEIKDMAEQIDPAVIIVNHNLSPVQQRNLERDWGAKVIDRTGLILEIFGERAETREGKIQVELAALEYQKSRLVRSWTHLERQRGGAGFMGGPGETQLEVDRRLITNRITKLKKDLEDVQRTRDLARKSRERVPYPIVAMVGYTNTGKSTLFNKMTGANVLVKDMVFATLDPTMRKLELGNHQDIILSDTVGFIADLPTQLIAAFRATLEQVQYADVILHVRDISQEDHEARCRDVIQTMEELGIDYENDDRIIEVLNKIDLLPEEDVSELKRKAGFKDNQVVISAATGKGLDLLEDKIEEFLSRTWERVSIKLDPADGEALAWLYRHASVLDRRDGADGIVVQVEIDPADLERFLGKFDAECTPYAGN